MRIALKSAKPLPYPREPRTIGDHLKKRRHDLGLYQKDVAAQLAVNQWTLIGWENNRKQPGIRHVSRIIAWLGYDPAFLTAQSLEDRLLAHRRRLGLSRLDLARELAVDEATLQKWEHGTGTPDMHHLALIEAAFAALPDEERVLMGPTQP